MIFRTDCMCWIIIAIQKKKDVKSSKTGTRDLIHIIIKNLLTGTGKSHYQLHGRFIFLTFSFIYFFNINQITLRYKMHSLHHNRVIMFSELIKPISRCFLTGLVFFMFSVGSLYLRIYVPVQQVSLEPASPQH